MNLEKSVVREKSRTTVMRKLAWALQALREPQRFGQYDETLDGTLEATTQAEWIMGHPAAEHYNENSHEDANQVTAVPIFQVEMSTWVFMASGVDKDLTQVVASSPSNGEDYDVEEIGLEQHDSHGQWCVKASEWDVMANHRASS